MFLNKVYSAMKKFFSDLFMYYTFFYVFGLINLGLLCFALTFDDPFNLIPDMTSNPYTIFVFYKTAAGCYTMSFNLVCMGTVFRQSVDKPMKALINLVMAFCATLMLIMVLTYSNISIFALLLFIFFGAQFAGLLVLNVDMLLNPEVNVVHEENPQHFANGYGGIFHITSRM